MRMNCARAILVIVLFLIAFEAAESLPAPLRAWEPSPENFNIKADVDPVTTDVTVIGAPAELRADAESCCLR